MSNGSDNRKPPGPPRVGPVVPTITATPASAPVVQRPATVPIRAPAPGAAPPARPQVPPTGARPPTGSAPAVPPVAARPGSGLVPPVAPARPGSGSLVPPVAPAARPGSGQSGVLVPPVAPAGRPGSGPSGVLVPPAAPAGRPGSGQSGVLVPPAAPPTRPGSGQSGVLVPPVAPPARPGSGQSGVLVPPVAPPARPGTGPSGVFVPPVARPATGSSAAVAPAPPARRGPIPESGAIEHISPQQAAALKQLAAGVDRLDYFEALGLTQQATPGEIKKAFYRESRTYHPDRFFHLPESEMRVHIGTIYKRLTEAYFVLRDDVKRKKYLADITGGDRANKLRYTEATEAELKAEARKAVEEEVSSNPKARPLFKAALADMEKENWVSAERNLKSGLMYDPGNARFKEQLVEVQKKAEAHRKATSSGYLIK